MDFALSQLLNGLSHASTLFLMAAGLTLIFGVTRIVNFAHGSFFMVGALVSAHVVAVWLPAWADSPLLYLAAMALGALAAGALGALVDLLLLRRMAGAPELYQLVATFGLSLAIHDAALWFFGPDEVFAPRFPGLKGAIEMPGGDFFPTYQLAMIALGPLVWLGLHVGLTRTHWGTQLRAATADRGMLAALGVNPKPLMTLAVVVGCALAGLGGALQLPREPANLQMDVNVVVETFVVVVMGGLGSVGGAFLASLMIGLIHSFGVSLFPQATLVLVFLTMGVVLAVRPQGLGGQLLDAGAKPHPQVFRGVKGQWRGLLLGCLAVVVWARLALAADAYWASLASDVLIAMVFGMSLQAMMALGGLVSFGHAAWLALGAYGAALSHVHLSAGLPLAMLCGAALSAGVAAVFGAVVVRSSGVYLAMLSLAMAQVVWATASQWVALSGGDNGIIGLQLVPADGRAAFAWVLAAVAAFSLAGLAALARSRFGLQLQAARDAPLRAAASGLAIASLRYRVFVLSAAWAGVAGALLAAHKGAVFPSVASVATSVDALLVVLLGGVHHLWGAVAGSAVLTVLSAELGRDVTYWRGALGAAIMALMVLAPSGLLAAKPRRWLRWAGRGSAP